MKTQGILIVVSGFSGAGKGTLMKELINRYEHYALSISATTRSPRVGEVHGREYFFKNIEDFEKMIAQEELIEYARYVNNYYGTPYTYVQEQLSNGKDVILEIEMQGALEVKAKYPDTLLLFVTPPSAETLRARLIGRGTETAEVVNARMNRAVEEAEYMEAYDYLIINDELDACVNQMHSIIQNAHYVTSRNVAFTHQIKEELEALF